MLRITSPYGDILLDDEDAPLVEGRRVVVSVGGNERRRQYHARVGHRVLARLIMDAPLGMEVDHVNHDNLDNRRENLRLATKQQNLANRRGWAKSNPWSYKGIVFRDRGPKGATWEARSKSCGPGRYTGQSANPHRAALKWNRATIRAYGEFAYLNDVPCFSGQEVPREGRCPACHAACACCCVCGAGP